MPFPNPGAQGAEPSCSIRAARCLCPVGLIHAQMSLSFRIPDVWDPSSWELPHGALVPQQPSWDLGMVFLSWKNLPSSWGIWKVGATPQQLQAPIQSHVPMAETDPFLPVWDTRSMGVQHHSQLIQTLGKSLLLPTPIPFGLPGTPSRAGSSGMGICASQCVGSLWSSSWGWGRSVGQEDLPRAEG